MNLTKTIRKTPVDLDLRRQGAAYDDSKKADVKYDDEDAWVSDGNRPIDGYAFCWLCLN
jgi:hypothetical protein